MSEFEIMNGFMGTTGILMAVFFLFSMLISLAVLGVFIFVFVKLISGWRKNEKSPRLTVPAEVIAKRSHTSHHHHHGTTHHTSTSTSYYVTFQVESGDRMELLIPRDEFGLLIEGDKGTLTFQGTRYLSFERN